MIAPPINRAKCAIAVAGLLATAYSWPLQLLFELKIGHALFGLSALLLYLGYGRRADLPTEVRIYVAAISLMALLHIGIFGVSETMLMGLVGYLFVPYLLARRILTSAELDTVLWIFSLTAFANLAALALQLAGFSAPLLVEDLTRTGGDVHIRYTSLLGGALGLGSVAFLTGIVSYTRLFTRRSRPGLMLLVFLASSVCVYFSYARRYYVLLLLGVLLVTLLSNRTSPWNRRSAAFVLATTVTILGFGLIFAVAGDLDTGLLVLRLESMFDFRSDEANFLRLTKWLAATNTFLANPWVGIGFGSSGVLGKSLEDIPDIYEIFTAESYFLQIAMEGGVLALGVFLLIAVFGAGRALRALPYESLPAVLILLYLIESIAGTALVAPLGAAIFWTAYGAVASSSPKYIASLKTTATKKPPYPQIASF